MAVRPGAGLLDGRFAGGQAVAEDGDYRPGGGAVPVRYGHRDSSAAPGAIARATSAAASRSGRQPGRAVGQGPHSGWR